MAAEDEGRTEEASEYKIEKARKEGRVAKSPEVSGSLVLLFTVMVLIIFSKYMFSQLINILTFFFSRTSTAKVNEPSYIVAFFNFFLKCFVPVAVVSIIAGVIGNIVQTRGFIFSFKPLEIKFSKIVPKFGEYFKKTIFSLKGIFNIVKSLGKVIIIVFVGYFYIKKDIYVLLEIIDNGDLIGAVSRIAKMAAQILITVSIILIAISILDFFVQRREFREEMKMTKQEQKEEFKELDGDPQVKGRLRQMQREILSRDIHKAVSESDVVITNPTHYAVALKYDTDSSPAPVLNAKGVDEMAQTIKRIARENDIPIVEDRPTARGLYTLTEIGGIIPESYYKTVALIFSHIDRYKNK